MTNKKSPKANLENKKTIFLLLGFVAALSLLYVSLEWSSERKVHMAFDFPTQFEEPVIIPQTITDPPPKPLPPKIAPKVVLPSLVPEFNPVDNNTGTEQPADIPTSEPVDDPGPVGPSYIPIEEEDPVVEFLPSGDMPQPSVDLLPYLAKNIRYPVMDQERGIHGRVVCQFIVDKDGSIIDIKVIRGVSPSIDKEAIRVIQSMPKWTPGKQHGKAVKVRFTLPINFTLTSR